MLAGQVTPFVDSPVIDPLTEVTGKSLHKFRLAAVKLNDSGLIFDIGKNLFGCGRCDTKFYRGLLQGLLTKVKGLNRIGIN